MAEKLILLSEDAFEQISAKLDAILAKAEEKNQKTKWLTNEDVLSLLDVSKSTLQSYRDRMLIPFYQVGRKILYKLSDIEDYMEQYKIVSPSKTKTNG
jgi:excisionase family DNA binding protein